MPVVQTGSGGSSQTIGQVFQSKHLWTWFNDTPTNYFDGAAERGEDFSTAYGTPVGVAVGGQIVRIVHNNNSINDVVELKDSSGAVWLYQHINATVRVGDVLGCGGIIGTENGLPAGDGYSTGPHIEVRYCPAGQWKITIDSWVEPWVNPRSIFSKLSSQSAGSVDAGSIGSLLNIGTFANTIATHVHLAPDATVATVFVAADTALQITNPFVVQTEPTFNAGPFSIPDPLGYIEEVAINLMNDASALIVRSACILFGVILLYFIAQAIFLSATNKALEPVGGISGAAGLATKLGMFA